MSSKDYDGCPKCGKGIYNLIEFGKAKLVDSEQELYLLYCFLEKKWISKPSDFDEIDPEVKQGLITILELEAKRHEKEELKAKAQESLGRLKAKAGF